MRQSRSTRDGFRGRERHSSEAGAMVRQLLAETGSGTLELVDDNLLVVTITPGAIVTIHDAMANMAAIPPGYRFPMLVNQARLRSMSAEARRLYSSEASVRQVTAVALLVESPVSRMIGQFFVGLNRPSYPNRLFDDEEAALAWLSGFPKVPN